MRAPPPVSEPRGAADSPAEAADRLTAPGGGTAGRALVLALAGVLLVSAAAQIRVTASGAAAAAADVRVVADAPIPLVLCVLDATGRTRCHGRDGVLSGPVDGGWAAVCGIADRRLDLPCADGGDCVFRDAAPHGEALGLVVLEARPPLFGLPRHRLVDSAILSPPARPASLMREMERGIQRVAQCFAPSDEASEGRAAQVLLRRSCADGPCRLQHSSVQMVAPTHPSWTPVSGIDTARGGRP